MKIIILDGESLNPGDLTWDGFAALGDIALYDRTPPALIIPRIGDGEVAIVNKVPMTREVFLACPHLKYVGVLATGYNTIDLAAATEYGVCVSNVPAYSTMAVTQMVFALLLEITMGAGHHGRAVREGRWTSCPNFCFWDFPLMELAGKTLGIIGYGRIGRQVEKVAQAFGMDTLYYSPSHSNATFDEIIATADVITLHCPLTPQSQGMINQETLARMKDGAILINTARGGLLVEEDVRKALTSGKLSALGADVVTVEPITENNPLLDAPNCILTPHIAWAPKETRKRLMDIAVGNLAAFMQGAPMNQVNHDR